MLRREARRAVRILGFGGITAGAVGCLMAHETLKGAVGDPALRDRWVRAWADGVLRLFAIDALVRGSIKIPEGHGALIVANHRSTFDAALLLRAFGGQLVARGDIADWPLIGLATKRVGTIYVDRQSSLSGAATMRKIRGLLRAGGRVGLFPEGTTFADDTVQPFHGGSFLAAQGTEAVIIPVGIAYESGASSGFLNESFIKHASRVAAAGTTRVAMVIGEGFRVHRDDKARTLALASHAEVQRLVHLARELFTSQTASPTSSSRA